VAIEIPETREARAEQELHAPMMADFAAKEQRTHGQ
jgi:hypothetical protein